MGAEISKWEQRYLNGSRDINTTLFYNMFYDSIVIVIIIIINPI